MTNRTTTLDADSPSIVISKALVSFYRFWHGTLHLPGAGRLLSWAAGRDRELQSFRLSIPMIGETTVDFRDNSAFYWLNCLLGDRAEEQGLNVVIRRYLRPETTFWDVGANSGLLSALVFASDPTVNIISIEPNPSLAARLRLLFANHSRVLVLERGLSSINGEASLLFRTVRVLSAHWKPGKACQGRPRKCCCPAAIRSLTSFLECHLQPSLKLTSKDMNRLYFKV